MAVPVAEFKSIAQYFLHSFPMNLETTLSRRSEKKAVRKKSLLIMTWFSFQRFHWLCGNITKGKKSNLEISGTQRSGVKDRKYRDHSTTEFRIRVTMEMLELDLDNDKIHYQNKLITKL